MVNFGKCYRIPYSTKQRVVSLVLGVAYSFSLSSTVAIAHGQMPQPPMLSSNHVEHPANVVGHHSPWSKASTGVPGSPGPNLDLSSSQIKVLSGNLGNFSSLTIDVAGRSEVVSLNTQLTDAIASLGAATKALASAPKGSGAYQLDLAKVNTDESTLHTDVFALIAGSATFADFSTPMNADHAALQSIAQKLDGMGLKTQASETTAYYPLSNYQHDFGKPGGGNPIAPPSGSTAFTNLDTATSEIKDIKPGDIGGTGGVTSATATQLGADKIAFSVTGGGINPATGKSYYSDALWRVDNRTAQAVGVKAVQLDTTFELTTQQLKNTSEIEKDIVIQKADGTFGLLGTQINTKTGEVDFWNQQTGSWVGVGSLGPLAANTAYNLQLGGTINDTGNPKTGSYTYSYYTLNGVQLQFTPKNGTYGTVELMNNGKPAPWAPGVYIQTQVDEGPLPKGSIAGMTETGQQLYISDTAPQS